MTNVRPFPLIITITLQNKHYLHLLFRKVKHLSVERAVGLEGEQTKPVNPLMSVILSSVCTCARLHSTPTCTPHPTAQFSCVLGYLSWQRESDCDKLKAKADVRQEDSWV